MTRKSFFGQFKKLAVTSVRFIQIVRKQGILALADEIEDMDDEYLKKGFRLAVDGVEPEYIGKILDSLAAQEKDKNTRALKTIQKDAVLCIQKGISEKLLLELLYSHTTLTKQEKAELENLLEQEEDTENLPERVIHESLDEFKAIARMPDKATQQILEETDSLELAKALKYAETEIVEAFCKNMSPRAAAMLKEDMQAAHITITLEITPETAIEAQKGIIEIGRRLEDEAEAQYENEEGRYHGEV
jgi:hypothetical protein